MPDRIFLVVVWLYVFGWAISTGYFYNRPICTHNGESYAACAFLIAVPWPFMVPANISVRIFTPST